MSDVTLFTQAELSILALALDQLVKNLGEHVQGSLSKTHGVYAINEPYFDASGDKIGDLVLAFPFGTPPDETVVYVPARIITSPTDPGAHTDSNGQIVSSTSEIAGVPILRKCLVTTSPSATAYSQASVYNQLLLAHSNGVVSDVRESQVHGGIANQVENTSDSLTHLVGRNTVTIGVNGRAFKLIGDTGRQSGGYGPPQPPRGIAIAMTPNDKTWSFVSPYWQHDQNRKGKLFSELYPSGQSFATSAVGDSVTYQWYFYGLSMRTGVPDYVSDTGWTVVPETSTEMDIDNMTFTLYADGPTLYVQNVGTHDNYSDMSNWFKCIATATGGSSVIALRYRTHE